MIPENQKTLDALAAMTATAELQQKSLTEQGKLTESLQEQFKKQEETIKTLEKKLTNRNLGVEGVPEKLVNKFLGDIAKWKYTGDQSVARESIDLAIENHKALGKDYKEKDIISAVTGAGGGVTLPVQVMSTIVDAARANSFLYELGVTTPNFEGLSAVTVPKETAILTPGYSAENTAISVSRPTFGTETFTPRKLSMIVGISEDFLKQGGAFVSAYVEKKAGIDMANKLEDAALNGRGQGFNEPQGILKRTDLTAFTGTTMGAGRRLTWVDLSDMENDIMSANRLQPGGKFGYYLHPRSIRGLKRQGATQGVATATDANSAPSMWSTPVVKLEKLSDVIGYPIKYSTLIPGNLKSDGTAGGTTSPALFGDFSSIWIATWGSLEMAFTNAASVGTVSAFENYLQYMRFTQMFDVGCVAPDSLVKVNGCATTGF